MPEFRRIRRSRSLQTTPALTSMNVEFHPIRRYEHLVDEVLGRIPGDPTKGRSSPTWCYGMRITGGAVEAIPARVATSAESARRRARVGQGAPMIFARRSGVGHCGRVPALALGATTIWHSLAIAEWAAEAFP